MRRPIWLKINGETESRAISRIFENREFGFLKVTVERPLRMSFEATPERIARLDNQTAFTNLATSKKRRDAAAGKREIEEGRKQQDAIRAVLATLRRQGELQGPCGIRGRYDEGREANRPQDFRHDQKGDLRGPW